MTNTAFSIIVTALLSSVLTWALAWLWYRAQLRAALQSTLEEVQAQFEERVKSGVTAAAAELLPLLREQVAQGFQDALKGSQAAGLVENAAGVVNVGGEIVAGGLSALFGLKPRR